MVGAYAIPRAQHAAIDASIGRAHGLAVAGKVGNLVEDKDFQSINGGC